MTSQDLADMKKSFKLVKVVVPRDLTQLMLFVKNFTVVCATVLQEIHPIAEHCFILLQEATENKKELNEQLKKKDTLAAELVRTIQIQTNIYCKSIERGRFTVYPTFGNFIFTISTDQFFPPTLPGPIWL